MKGFVLKMNQWKLIAIVALLLISPLCIGCGGGSANYDLPASDKVPTAKENIADWLNGVIETGEIDSGGEMMKDEVAKLKTEGFDKADEIQSDIDALLATKEAKAIKSKANSILAKLK